MTDIALMAGIICYLVLLLCLFSYLAIRWMLGIDMGRNAPDEFPLALPLAPLVPLLLLAGCVYSIRRALRIAHDDERVLIAFVAETIDSPSVAELRALVQREFLGYPRTHW